jgi:hypothetical protein
MSPFQLRIASNLVHLGRGPAGIAGAHADECGARGRTCNPLPGGFGHQPLGTMTGVRGARWTQGQAGVGNAHSTDRPTLFATSQEAWHEVAPRTTKVPLARAAVERRQSCAPRWVRGRARRHGLIPIASVGVSPPNFFLSFFPFVIAGRRPGNPCRGHAYAVLPPALPAAQQHGPPA